MGLERRLAVELASNHPDEAAAALEALSPEEAAAFVARLPADLARGVLRRTTAHSAGAMLSKLEAERAGALVASLPPDVAAGYLRHVPEEIREGVLATLEDRHAEPMRVLLRFREGTAGALMDPAVLALPVDLTASEAIGRVRESARHARYNLYVVDRDDRLVGVLNMRELMLAKPRARMDAIMRRDVIRIASETETGAVVEHPGWQEVHALPVVDADGTYLGAIRYRTLRRLEKEHEATELQGDATAAALADLFQAGISGLLVALSGAELSNANRGGHGRQR